MPGKKEKNKLLLHICCAGCGAYVGQLLSKIYKVSFFYYNPNIYSESEYLKRRENVEKIAAYLGLEVIYLKYDHGAWLKKIRGHEKDPEKGERCFICYQDRINTAAAMAAKGGFGFFSTSLSISPHKISSKIIAIGKASEKKYGVSFVDTDFKKKNGFKKSLELSRELKLYRQNYCGCEFSLRKEAKDFLN